MEARRMENLKSPKHPVYYIASTVKTTICE